jgi:C-terminal processing protease CtpA/Prc
VKAGDVIVAVDGRAAAAMPLAAARGRMKGAAGRKVRLTLDGGAQRVVTLRDLV